MSNQYDSTVECRINNGESFPAAVINYTQSSSSSSNLLTQVVSNQYRFTTCRTCFKFIIGKDFTINNESELILSNYTYESDVRNLCDTFYRFLSVNINECIDRVSSCCKAAELCCQTQISMASNSMMNDSKSSFLSKYCPITWDGVSCINKTIANSVAKVKCPTFIPDFSFDIPEGRRECTSDGTWLRKENNGTFWEPTDYYKCFPTQSELTICYVSIAALSLSILLLIISTVLFLSFRSLRRQKRIQIHINLFIALLLKSIIELIARVSIDIAIYDHLSMKAEQTKYLGWLQDGKSCKLITIFMRYFQNSSFRWMCCEALFLYYLLFHTFDRTISIKPYLIIGWLEPVLDVTIYVLVRIFVYDTESPNNIKYNCWIDETQHIEYIIRGPNILCQLLNIIFLAMIIGLIRKMPRQTVDRNDWAYTLKAVIVLVPLFGLHLLLVAFNLHRESPFYLTYNIIQSIIQYSEGTAVSLAFCAFNHEVRNTISRRFNRMSNTHLFPPYNNSHQRISNRSSGRAPSSISRHIQMRASNNSNFNVSLPLVNQPIKNSLTQQYIDQNDDTKMNFV